MKRGGEFLLFNGSFESSFDRYLGYINFNLCIAYALMLILIVVNDFKKS